ncbi:MAG TPA: YbaK/EbsC family protein [Verrucomicrobiae bacterium]|nr:YbaK/EbsC family protein [Verrucomicrobiae bacterium]
MGVPARLIELLNRSEVPYQVVHHPEAFTAQELAAIEHVKGRSHAKVVMVRTDAEVLMTVLPADHRVDLEKLDKAVGRKTALATEEDFKALFPDCAVGTMPPFGELYGVPAYLDSSLTDAERIVFEAGTHSDAIRMRYADYVRVAKPIVADFAVKMQ